MASSPPPELTLAQQARLVEALRAQLQQRGRAPVLRLETHISWVLVTPAEAWKIKKAVALGFLDFTRLEQRRRCCDEELRLNRRLAPALYLGTVPIGGTLDSPELGTAGPAIEYAVHMRAFAQDALWDRRALRGELTAAEIDELAGCLHAFHARAAAAPPTSGFGRAAQVRAPMLDNLDELERRCRAAPDRADLQALRRWEAASFARLAPVFEQRRVAGRVRECHGDLHLRNIARIDGHATVFDCIEFNDAFRWIDTMSEIAFLAMDLRVHGLPGLAHRFVDAMLQHGGDHGGLAVLDYYIAYRALVRAKIAALRAGQPGAAAEAVAVRADLDLAIEATRPRPLALMITHGLSGSGKTTWTQRLLEATGAVRVRADVERKRLAGLAPLARSGSALAAGLYDAHTTDAVYAHLCATAATVLRAGHPVVLDATFLRRAQRERARAVAAATGVPFLILDFEVDLATLRQRVQRRHDAGLDASEADVAVLEAQWRTREPLGADERGAVVDFGAAASSPLQSAVTDWTALRQRWMLAGMT